MMVMVATAVNVREQNSQAAAKMPAHARCTASLEGIAVSGGNVVLKRYSTPRQPQVMHAANLHLKVVATAIMLSSNAPIKTTTTH